MATRCTVLVPSRVPPRTQRHGVNSGQKRPRQSAAAAAAAPAGYRLWRHPEGAEELFWLGQWWRFGSSLYCTTASPADILAALDYLVCISPCLRPRPFLGFGPRCRVCDVTLGLLVYNV
jgi:hypothetical protein